MDYNKAHTEWKFLVHCDDFNLCHEVRGFWTIQRSFRNSRDTSIQIINQWTKSQSTSSMETREIFQYSRKHIKNLNVSKTCLQISYAISLHAIKCETSHAFIKVLVLSSAIYTASIYFDEKIASQITAVPFWQWCAKKKAFRNDNRCYWPICGKNCAVELNHLTKLNWQRLVGCRRSENCRSLKGNWNRRAIFM